MGVPAPRNSGTPRVALIGCGPWGRKILDTVLQRSDLHLARVASRNPETHRLLPQGTPIDADWRTSLAAGDIDGVIIATPPPVTPHVCALAVTQGKAVFVEKPVAMQTAQAEALLDRAVAAGAIVHVNHIDLFNGAWAALREHCRDMPKPWTLTGELGRRWPARADCPVLWEWGPHPLACLLSLADSAPELLSSERLPPELPVDPGDRGGGTLLRLRLAFHGGQAELTFGNGMARRARWVRVQGPEQGLLYDDGAASKLVRIATGETAGTGLDHDPTPPLARGLARFARSMREGQPDLADLRTAASITRILVQAETMLGATHS